MAIELGEVREKMARDCWTKAEDIAGQMKDVDEPFYIIYVAKPDKRLEGTVVHGKVAAGGVREAWRCCHERPPFILGMLVWYVDNKQGLFSFVPELSSPPDIPIDPALLSTKSYDCSVDLMNKAQEMNKTIPLVS